MRRRARAAAVLTLTLLLQPAGLAQEDGLAIVAHPSVAVEAIPLAELRDRFLKRRRYWDDGSPVRPVDRNDGSRERALFLRRYLDRTPAEMARYWIEQRLSTGDAQPLQLDSDAQVLRIVSALPGAIGYVRRSSLGVGRAGVRVIRVRGVEGP